MQPSTTSSVETGGLDMRNTALDKDIARPRRPPRRISRIFNSSPDSSATEEVNAPSASRAVQEVLRATGSQLDRIKGQSRSTDEDLDRTPTKYNHYTASTRDNGNHHREDENGHRNSQSRVSDSREGGKGSTLHKLSIPNLRHQSSAATIKSSDLIDVADLYASTSTATTARPESRAAVLREDGPSKSSLYEKEIRTMRSESRLGDRDEERNERSFSRSSIQQGTDATDTSGTEGSGPIIENRRRKKSSTSSSSKRAAARAANVRDQRDPTVTRSSPQKERIATSSARSNYSGRDPYATMTSPLRTESAMEFNLPSRFPPTRRAPLASTFQTSRYRSDGLADAESEVGQRRTSNEHGELWSRGEELPAIDRRDDRRRRHVSEAMNPPSDPPSRQGRMVVDTSGVSKHLSRPSRYGTVTEAINAPAEWSDRSSNRSVSEVIRPRKISTSSSISLRSSGGASELHRSASRASLRKSHGKDVFDDGGVAPPLPSHSGHPLSPRLLARDQLQQQTLAMAQALKQKQERVRETGTAKGEDWRKEVDDLQTRIDQLAMAAAATSPQLEVYSRSSSRASASAPRSSHSNISSTPSATLGRRPNNRPSTEPRLPRTDAARAPSDVSSGYLRYETSSRLGLRENDRRLPVTPNMADQRLTSNSRMSGVHTGPMPSTGRLSSLGQSRKSSLSASSSAGPLHERNLLNSFEIFERYLLESTRGPLDSASVSPRSASEAVDLVSRFKETSDTAISINAGLRSVLQNVLELQIDAEVGESAVDHARLFADIDRSLSAILRDSDEQVRSLTDGLITFTRAEKERDRMRKKRSEQSNAATVPRSTSRLSSLGLTQMSPGKERLLGRESQQATREATGRSSSFDMRRSLSIRDRLTASNSNTSMQAVESRSEKSSDSGQQSRLSRRFSLLHESSPGTSTTSSHLPPSPYSPSPNPTSNVPTRTSPTLDMHATSDRHRVSRLSHTMNHARSFSELSPKIRSEVNSEILMQRSPLLRKDKSSTNSVQTVRAPSSLSPRRSRLSFPRVSATNVSAMSMTGSTTGDDENSSASPNASEGRNGHNADAVDNYRDETRSLFKSFGHNRGLRAGREM